MSRQPAISEASFYFEKASVMLHAPCLLSYNNSKEESLYIFDSQQKFLQHPSPSAVYSEKGRQNYLSFTPVNQKNWVLDIGGNYLNIQQEVNKISLISFLMIISGLLLKALFLFIVINRIIQPVKY